MSCYKLYRYGDFVTDAELVGGCAAKDKADEQNSATDDDAAVHPCSHSPPCNKNNKIPNNITKVLVY